MKKLFLATFLFLSIASVSFAQNTHETQTNSHETQVNSHQVDNDSGVLPKIENPLKFNSLIDLINGLIDLALKIGTILAVLALIWVGFRFILAQGNDSKLTDAKNALLWVIIGIAILFSAKIVVEIIKGTLGQFTNLK